MTTPNFNKPLVITYICIVLITLAALVAIKEFNISYPLTVTSAYPSTELSVVGEGKVDVVPDTATITAGIVVNSAADVPTAEKQINEINNKIIEVLKSLNIPKTDIQTSNYSINPNYVYDKEQRIQGYNASATVTVKTHDMTLAPTIMTKLTEAGANQVNGVQFSVDSMTKYREEARNKAIADAKAQAEKLASQLGIRLGKITNIVESHNGAPIPMMAKAYDTNEGMGAGMMNQPATIEPGTQTITSTVTLFFEKK